MTTPPTRIAFVDAWVEIGIVNSCACRHFSKRRVGWAESRHLKNLGEHQIKMNKASEIFGRDRGSGEWTRAPPAMATWTLWYSNTGADAANWLTRYDACVVRTQPLLPRTHRQWSETRLLPSVSKHGFPPPKVVIRKNLTTHCQPPI